MSTLPSRKNDTLLATHWLTACRTMLVIGSLALFGWTGQPAIAQQLDGSWQTPATQAPDPETNQLGDSIRNQIGLAPLVDQPATPQASAEPASSAPPSSDGVESDLNELSQLFQDQSQGLTSRESIGPSIKAAVLLAILSLAPAIVLMTTCYVRIIVVLTLLKQAFGAQQLPPMQVLTALSLFLTMLVMAPVWNQVKHEAIDPYTEAESEVSWEEAWQRGLVPIKTFMIRQIEASGNDESIALFYRYLPESTTAPTTLHEVPINVLLPAFLVSELKVAFLLGFQIYLPFLVLDLIVSSVTVSTGMMMLPPTMVSFPLKLILFVMVDGWNLVVGMLLQSFAPVT